MNRHPPRVEVAGLECTVVTIPTLVEVIVKRLSEPGGHTSLSVMCANAHIHNLASSDAQLHRDLDTASIVALDGMSLVWALRHAHGLDTERCNMTEAFRAFLASGALPPVEAYVIGLTRDEAAQAAAAINRMGNLCRVTRTLGGYEDVDTYVAALAEGPVDLVLIGCGTPRSERIAAELATRDLAAVIWHVGAGTLRFLAGTDREAPAWMRRAGLQWLHRLLLNPRDLWRRYLLGNPKFVWRVLRSERVR